MLETLKGLNWTISEFLYHMFRLEDTSKLPVHRSQSNGVTVWKFLSGNTKYKPIEIIDLWLRDPAGAPDKTSPTSEHAHMYSLHKPYISIKNARVALTSMAVQLCERQLLKEMRSAVKGSSGLHGSQVGKRGHMELACSDIGLHTVKIVQQIIETHQPLTLELLKRVATPEQRKVDGVLVIRKTRPPGLVATEVISSLDFSHTKFARLHASARSIMFFANGASHDIFNYGSRIAFSQSYYATYATLARMSSQRAEHLKVVGRDEAKGLVMRMDNVQQYTKKRELRIGRETVMKIGVAATVAEMWDYDASVLSAEKRNQILRQNKRAALTPEGLVAMVDVDYLQEVLVLQWLQTLVNYVPELAEVYQAKVVELYRTKGSKLRAPDRKTVIHPLGTSAKNENVITELRDVAVDFLGQIGQHDGDHDADRLFLMGGDGLTFERLLKLKEYVQFQDDSFKQFANVVPFLETWHAEWTFVSLIFETHWGEALTADPSKLGHSATQIDQKTPTNLKKVDYYAGIYVAYLVLDVRMLDCFRIHFKTSDIFAYLRDLKTKNAIPSLDSLHDIARTLYQRYTTRLAYQSALTGMQKGTGIAVATETWRDPACVGGRAPDTPQNPSDGDRTLAQSMLFMMDTLLSRTVAQAVAMGDVGCVYEGIKMMMFHFAGSGHTKYAGYILEMIATLELEMTEDVRDTFLRNWLVNPSGERGRHQEGDLMQEHLNLALEDAVKRSGSEWDGRLIRDVISRNIHYFVDLKNGWGESVGLKKREGHHPQPHSKPEVRILLQTYKATHLHCFMSGRSYASSPETNNTFALGFESYQKGRLQKWIVESMRSRQLLQRSSDAITALQAQIEDEIDEQESETYDVEPLLQVTRGDLQLVDGQLIIEVEGRNDIRDAITVGEAELAQELGDIGLDNVEDERDDA